MQRNEQVPAVEASEGRALVADGAVLLDVREPGEFAAGHAPGAVPLPMGEVAARAHELPRDRRIVAICRSGARSGTVTRALLGAGFDVVNLAGGMHAWADAGFPVVTHDGDAGVVA
jgi:rhodanese-related sulfurtransferase